MVITMSDYLLEQEISTASCGDILLEQVQAEADVYSAIATAYAKEFMMLEYASETYLEEAEDSEDNGKKESKFKKFWSTIWEAIKRFFKLIGEKLAQFGRWIKSLFKGKPSEKLREEYEKMSDEEAEKFVKEIVGDRDVETDGKGGVSPHIYETETTKAWIENFNNWCDVADTTLNAITSGPTGKFGNRVGDKLKELKRYSSTMKDLTNKASGPKKPAKATVKTMIDFCAWYEAEGHNIVEGMRDKIQLMDKNLTSSKETLEKLAEKNKESYSEYIAFANQLRSNISEVSANVLKELSGKEEFFKKIEKALVDYGKAKRDTIIEAKRKKAVDNGEPVPTRAEVYKAMNPTAVKS